MFAEYEQIARRLVERIGGILQAEKCLIMLHDPAADTLYAIPPALGFSAAQLFRLNGVRIDGRSISADVWREKTPVIIHDAAHDPRANREGLEDMGVRNSVSVPLFAASRDRDGRLLAKDPIGVLHAFNKWQGGMFTDEDLRLLQRMAVNAAAVVRFDQEP